MLIKEELLKIKDCNFAQFIKTLTDIGLKRVINTCKSEDKIYS